MPFAHACSPWAGARHSWCQTRSETLNLHPQESAEINKPGQLPLPANQLTHCLKDSGGFNPAITSQNVLKINLRKICGTRGVTSPTFADPHLDSKPMHSLQKNQSPWGEINPGVGAPSKQMQSGPGGVSIRSCGQGVPNDTREWLGRQRASCSVQWDGAGKPFNEILQRRKGMRSRICQSLEPPAAKVAKL